MQNILQSPVSGGYAELEDREKIKCSAILLNLRFFSAGLNKKNLDKGGLICVTAQGRRSECAGGLPDMSYPVPFLHRRGPADVREKCRKN